jgi:uncharacterized protein YpbB
MYNEELITRLYSTKLYKALCEIEEQRQLIELRRERKNKLKKIKDNYERKK